MAQTCHSLDRGASEGNEWNFKKSVRDEIAELDVLIAELAGDIRNADDCVRPKLLQLRAAEQAIAATIEDGFRFADRESRRPHYVRILELRATYGGKFKELDELKRRMRNAQKLREHLVKLESKRK